MLNELLVSGFKQTCNKTDIINILKKIILPIEFFTQYLTIFIFSFMDSAFGLCI